MKMLTIESCLSWNPTPMIICSESQKAALIRRWCECMPLSPSQFAKCHPQSYT